MFFTREDILKIQQALLQLGVKDSELPSAEPVTYDDTLSIVQDGKNKQIKIEDFFNQISLWKREDFINITDKYDEHYISLIEAIKLVPILQKKDGLVITFQDIEGNWEIYQFRGNITEFLNEEKWFDLYDYRNYIVQSIIPDEEDLTASTPDENGNSLVHLKDRVYNPTIFSGKGYRFVRKNIINVELATIKISVINPTTLEGDIYFNINNRGTKVHLSPTIHNTTKLVSEAIKDALNIVYTDYKVTVANSIVTLTRKYSGNISPTTFEMYNTGVRVIVENSTTIDKRNIITQKDINKTDTIYEIKYDFDLDGKTITIPNNCVLYFTSGKFYNGNINMDNTVISTLYEDVLSEVNINGSYYNIQEHIKNHQRQLDDKQSQIDDKQQQITANDEDISLLQTRSTQMEEIIESIAVTGGASQATAVTYNNEKSKLTAINIQSAVDEVVEKTTIKDEEGNVLDTPFRVIENEEFIMAVVDSEDRILVGIKYDGEPYFPNHEMYSVITNEEWLYAIIDAENKVLGGFRANDGHMIVGSIDISTFIANAIINIEDIKERTASLSTIENDEYLSVETDADSKVIGYTAPDGSHYLYKVKSETIPTEFTHIEDPEGRTEITTDAEDKILGYRDSEGTLNEAKIAVNNLLIKNKKSFLDENRKNGFDVSPIDYSFETELHIPQPTCAKVNFSGIDNIPQEKFANVHGYMEFWDMNGNYFKKEVIMNAQGRSSLGFPKKNIAIDICNNNGFDDSDTFKLQIGDWVPQDSFHLKGYINDPFRGICPVSYKLYDEIVKTRGIFNDYVWKRAIVNTSNITETSNGAETQKETAKQFDTGARCFPDGFPCIVYLNNEFYGIYSWQLKKHRDNYHLEKKNADNIHLDGNITDASILNANGDASKIGWNALDEWHSFEIRNPKNLILMNGSKYDADFNAGELIDDSSSVYNPSDKNHILSSKVKKHILELSKVMTKLSDAKSIYDLSSKNNSDKEMFKSVFETYFDIDNLIDYLILSDVVRNADGFGDNWQWFTYNGVKWYIGLYDTDMILGNQAGLVQTIDPPLDHHVCQTYQYKYLLEFYTDELQARYKELRDIKIIDADHICNLLKEWMDRIGNRSVFEKEWNKWSVFVKNDSLYRVKKWLDNSIKNMDSIYKYNV